MKNFLKENLREIVGWVAIVYILLVFFGPGYHRPFESSSGGGNTFRDIFKDFEAAIALTILILIWLRLNKK